jgi:hypothetical protein
MLVEKIWVKSFLGEILKPINYFKYKIKVNFSSWDFEASIYYILKVGFLNFYF